MQLLIGADPELFLKAGSVFHSGYGVIPGTKEEPHPVPFGAVQVDGMAVEFNIIPAANEDEFIHHIDAVLATLKAMIPEQFDVVVSPVAIFEEQHMAQQPLAAKRLGCDPDFDAYEEAVNNPPRQHPVMRTAAGHVHLGWTEGRDVNSYDHFLACCSMVRQLDFYLGLPSVLLDPDTQRKEMYGKAGAFRPKPYGLEYRVLSNFWLTDPKLIRWVYGNTQLAFHSLAVEGRVLAAEHGDIARECINTNDKAVAEKLIQEIGIPFPA